MNHFSIRTFALFIGVAIDGSFDLKWINKQPQSLSIPDNFNIVVRNIIQLFIILFVFGLCILNDKYRIPPLGPIESSMHPVASKPEAVDTRKYNARQNGESRTTPIQKNENCMLVPQQTKVAQDTIEQIQNRIMNKKKKILLE